MSRVKKLNLGFLALVAIVCLAIAAFATSGKQASAFEANSGTVGVEIISEEIIITADMEGADTYQYWIRQAVATSSPSIEDSYLWVQKSSSFAVADAYDIGGYYYILVRGFAQDGTFAGSYFKTWAIEATQITEVLIDDAAATENNYLQAGKSYTVVVKTENADSVVFSDGEDTVTKTAAEALAGFSYTALSGNYSVSISATGTSGTNSMQMEVKGYNAQEDYTKITDVKIKNNGNYVSFGEGVKNGATAQFEVAVASVGTPKTFTVAVGDTTLTDADGDGIYTGEVTFAAYGVYTFTVKVATGNVVDDYFTGYYNYGRATAEFASVNMTPSGDKLVFNADASFGDVAAKYQIVKWDVRGEYAITGWLDTIADYEVVLHNNGIYRFEVRAKGEGAGSWEVRKIFDTDSVSTQSYSLSYRGLNGKIPTEIKAQTPYVVEVDTADTAQLFKFVVSGYGQWRVEEYYSPDNKFLWVPTKAGNYNIEVYKLSTASYGWADNISRETVEVVESLSAYSLTDGDASSLFNWSAVVSGGSGNVGGLKDDFKVGEWWLNSSGQAASIGSQTRLNNTLAAEYETEFGKPYDGDVINLVTTNTWGAATRLGGLQFDITDYKSDILAGKYSTVSFKLYYTGGSTVASDNKVLPRIGAFFTGTGNNLSRVSKMSDVSTGLTYGSWIEITLDVPEFYSDSYLTDTYGLENFVICFQFPTHSIPNPEPVYYNIYIDDVRFGARDSLADINAINDLTWIRGTSGGTNNIYGLTVEGSSVDYKDSNWGSANSSGMGANSVVIQALSGDTLSSYESAYGAQAGDVDTLHISANFPNGGASGQRFFGAVFAISDYHKNQITSKNLTTLTFKVFIKNNTDGSSFTVNQVGSMFVSDAVAGTNPGGALVRVSKAGAPSSVNSGTTPSSYAYGTWYEITMSLPEFYDDDGALVAAYPGSMYFAIGFRVAVNNTPAAAQNISFYLTDIQFS